MGIKTARNMATRYPPLPYCPHLPYLSLPVSPILHMRRPSSFPSLPSVPASREELARDIKSDSLSCDYGSLQVR